MVDLNGTLLAQIINFLILTGILALLAYKPLLRILEGRQKFIAERLETSERDKMQAEQLKKEYEQQLAAAHTEAQRLVAETINFAEQAKEQILAETRAANAKLLQTALAEIAAERAGAMARLKDEVVNLSLLTATKIIDRKLDAAVNAELVNETITKPAEPKSGNLPC
ncbi:F0F1 ATP synthase subunit B [Sporomusa aerivorans]|uniref:F0F1 ATP synthase subunit B n=1 Tax=Sporomusa aerivorans TaxID=204936 RepID=UPI00352AF9AF